MSLERAASLIPCLVVLALPAWSGWRLVRGLRAGNWRRPGWFGEAAAATLFVGAMAWLWGAASGGGLLDLEEACEIRHQQPYDEVYRDAHREEWSRLFPLSSKCNAGYDLVPGWINPTVAVSLLLFMASAAGLVWAAARQLRQRTAGRC